MTDSIAPNLQTALGQVRVISSAMGRSVSE